MPGLSSAPSSALLLLLFSVLVLISSSSSPSSSSFASAQSFNRSGKIDAGNFDDDFRTSVLRGDFLYTGSFVVGGTIAKFNIKKRQHVQSVESGNPYLFSCTADPSGTVGYFGSYDRVDVTGPSTIVKYALNLMTKLSGSVTTEARYGRLTAAHPVNSTHTVWASGAEPGKLLLLHGEAMQFTATAAGVENQENRFQSLAVDQETKTVYVGTLGSPGVLVKYSVGDGGFERLSRVLGSASSEENQFFGSVLMPGSGIIVIGCSTNPGRIVAFDTSSMTRLAGGVGDTGQNRFWSGVAGNDGASVYFATGQGASPGQVVKFSLNGMDTSSPSIERVDSAPGASGEDSFWTSALAPGGTEMWVTTGTLPGVAVSFDLDQTTTTTTEPTTSTTTSTTTTTTSTTTTSSTTTSTATTLAPTTTTVATTAAATTTTSLLATSGSTGTSTPPPPTTTASTTSGEAPSSMTTTASGATTPPPVAPSTTTAATTPPLPPATNKATTTTAAAEPPTTSSTTTSTTTTLDTDPADAEAGTPVNAAPHSNDTANSNTTTTAAAFNHFENYTAPGLSVEDQDNLVAAATTVALTAAVLGSPSMPLTMTRALAVFNLAGCPKASNDKEPWAETARAFPKSFFPGSSAGSVNGGHARMAIVGFILGAVLVAPLLGLLAWTLFKYLAKKMATKKQIGEARWQDKLRYLVATAPFPYFVGTYLMFVSGYWSDASGLLAAVEDGDGVFVDIVLLTAIPWCFFFVGLYFFNKNLSALIFQPAAVAAAEEEGSNEEEHRQQQQQPEVIFGMVHSKLFVVPNPKEARWFHNLKLRLAEWLRTDRGRYLVAGHFAWRRQGPEYGDDESVDVQEVEAEVEAVEHKEQEQPPQQASDGDDKPAPDNNEEKKADADNNNNEEEDAEHPPPAQEHQQVEQEEEKKTATTTTTKLLQHRHAFRGDFMTRWRSLFMKLIGPPFPDEKKCEQLRDAASVRIRLATLSFPFLGLLASIAAFANGLARADMEKNCSGALVVIVIVNLIAGAVTLAMRPFVVPVRNHTAIFIDLLICLSSVIALAVASSSTAETSAIAVVQVVTSISVTVAAILELLLSFVRNLLFFVLGLKLVSGKEAKKLRKQYAKELEEEEELMNKEEEQGTGAVSRPLLPHDTAALNIPSAESSPARPPALELTDSDQNDDDDDIAAFVAAEQQRKKRCEEEEAKREHESVQHRGFVPSVSPRFDLELEEAARRFEAVSAALAEKEEQKQSSKSNNAPFFTPPVSPRGGAAAAAAAASSPSPSAPDVAPPPASAASLYLNENMSSRRVQQEVALGSLLYLICNVFRHDKTKQPRAIPSLDDI